MESSIVGIDNWYVHLNTSMQNYRVRFQEDKKMSLAVEVKKQLKQFRELHLINRSEVRGKPEENGRNKSIGCTAKMFSNQKTPKPPSSLSFCTLHYFCIFLWWPYPVCTHRLFARYPDRLFSNFGALTIDVRRSWTTYKSPISWPWGSKTLEMPVGMASVCIVWSKSMLGPTEKSNIVFVRFRSKIHEEKQTSL